MMMSQCEMNKKTQKHLNKTHRATVICVSGVQCIKVLLATSVLHETSTHVSICKPSSFLSFLLFDVCVVFFDLSGVSE